LVAGFERWARNEGATSSQAPGLTFHRHTAPTEPYVGIMDACLSLVVQGKKRVVLGRHTFDYGSAHFLLTSIDLPVTAWVTQATPKEPYLGLLLKIDLALVRALLTVVDHAAIDAMPPLAIARADATPDLLEALLRLCRLSERPSEVPLFAEQMQREIIYRLLTSPIGPRLRALASIQGAPGGVLKALEWLQANYRERQSTDALAAIACMGVSTFHKHFKAITSMSPIQYRKHLQLNEARRLMIVHGTDAASAAYSVGYASPSQFSREYRRAFGQPPIASVASLKPSAKLNSTVSRVERA
jgi:AraC-like DNA-binding protein